MAELDDSRETSTPATIAAFKRLRARQMWAGAVAVFGIGLCFAWRVPQDRLFGIPPFVLPVIGVILALGAALFARYTWRCPACRKPLGKQWNALQCSACSAPLQETAAPQGMFAALGIGVALIGMGLLTVLVQGALGRGRRFIPLDPDLTMISGGVFIVLGAFVIVMAARWSKYPPQ